MHQVRRGFTLVELMVVVAIIGVLAALAIVGFRRYSASSRSGEAISMLNNLRMAQESFRAENLRYNGSAAADGCGAAPGTIAGGDYYPRDPTGVLSPAKVQWGPANTVAGVLGCFNRMGFRAAGAVRYNYATTAGAPGGALGAVAGRTANNSGPAPALTPPVADPWYIAAAVANLSGADNDGAKSFVWVSSQSTEAFVGSESD
jgi:type IV pilus assembly protein PilA